MNPCYHSALSKSSGKWCKLSTKFGFCSFDKPTPTRAMLGRQLKKEPLDTLTENPTSTVLTKQIISSLIVPILLLLPSLLPVGKVVYAQSYPKVSLSTFPDIVVIEPATEFKQAVRAKEASDAKKAEEARIAEEKRIADLKAKEAAEAASRTVVSPTAPSVAHSGSHEDWMRAAGIDPSDFGYVDYIVSKESGWRVNATNGQTWGLCQALPGSKMASAGADWQTNPVTQLRWCSSYAASKGGWAASYNLWLKQSWW